MGKRSKETAFTVEGLEGEARLDKVLRTRFPNWGRQAVGRVISGRKVRVNGTSVWLASWKVRSGDRIEVIEPPTEKPSGPQEFNDSWILAEEQDLFVINKPAGLRSQGTRAGGKDNLLSLAQHRFGEVRLFHRLDRDTSGVCLLTRPGPVNAYLDAAFKQRAVEKEYLAVIGTLGQLAEEGTIRLDLARHATRSDMMQAVPSGKKLPGSKWAETRYRVEKELANGILVRLWPLSGRTHQLRVHLAHLGAPIVGDRLYGGRNADRMMLHAYRLRLPRMGEFPMREYLVEAEGFG